MAKKVYLDADYKSVAQGSTEAAWVFTDGDERIEKFRTAVKARNAVAAGKPIPGSTAAAEDAEEETVERVGRRGK